MIALILSTDWGKQNKGLAILIGTIGDILFTISVINVLTSLK